MLPYMDIERIFFFLNSENCVTNRNGLELAGMDRNSNQDVLTPFHFS